MGKKSKNESRKDLGGLLSSMQDEGKPARGFPSGDNTSSGGTTGSDKAAGEESRSGEEEPGAEVSSEESLEGSRKDPPEAEKASATRKEEGSPSKTAKTETIAGASGDTGDATGPSVEEGKSEKASGEGTPDDDPGGRATSHAEPEEENEAPFYAEGTYRRKGGERQARLTTYVDDSTKRGVGVMASSNGQSVSEFLADLLEEHDLRFEEVVKRL